MQRLSENQADRRFFIGWLPNIISSLRHAQRLIFFVLAENAFKSSNMK
jgi:hypothetical protein